MGLFKYSLQLQTTEKLDIFTDLIYSFIVTRLSKSECKWW